MKAKCISAEQLADYFENRLSAKARARVERHLATCESCLDTLLLFRDMSNPEKVNQLQHLTAEQTERVVASVLDAGTGMRGRQVIEKWKQKGAEWKEALQDLFTFAPAQAVCVRGSGEERAEGAVTVKKAFGGVEVEIEIQKWGERTASIRVALMGCTDGEDSPVRVTLVERDREISSFLLTMAVTFEDVSFGRYGLLFARKGEILGEYRFRIEESSNDG